MAASPRGLTAPVNAHILAAMLDDAEFYNQRIGTTLRGKWKIERLLGFGGMAAVYVAVHTIGHRVAIKILHPEVAASRDLRARFEQEAHAVNRFSHPGAVSITDYDVAEDGCPFLVMELLEGDSLQSLLEKCGTLEPAQVLRIADELLDVLAAAHGHGIVHRDIKPDNLFVLRDGRVKVLDFGIARMKEGAPREVKTKTGMAMGTITYMPPEQLRGEHVDGRADLFAAGATMFRLLSGRRLHEADNQADMLVKMASTPVPPLQSVVPALSVDLCRIVDCALAFRKEDRYPDALTMQKDVRAVRAGEAPAFASARPAAPASGAAAAPAPGVAPLEATVAEPVRGAAVDATVAESPAAKAPTPASLPATWVTGEPPPGAPVPPPVDVAPISVAAQSAVVPLNLQKRPANVLLIVIAAVAVLALLVVAAAVVILVAFRPSPTAASSSASQSDAAEPADTSTANATSTLKTPGKAPPVATTKAPPVSTTTPLATSTATQPVPTATSTSTPATATTPPPGNTGKTPPGQDKKDKKNH
jgi:eukaryotic-like serine/threonine-protein kinase